jgi:ABC-2 type transport system permease protein
MWTILRAEIKRYFLIQWSSPGDSLSWFLYTFLVLIAALVILNGIRGGVYGQEDQLLVLVGWLTWMVASDCMSELPHTISEEAQTGTLEQVCLVPIPLAGLLAIRSLAYLIGAGIKGLLAAILAAVFIAPLPAGPELVVLFLISLVGAYGLGFALAGVALVFKRSEALVGILFSLMIFMTGALVGLEPLGWVYDSAKYTLPLTWGISLMREAIVVGVNSSQLVQWNGLVELSIHSVVYCLIGLCILIWGFRLSRKNGSLTHY